MALDVIIDVHPERIRSLDEVNETILKIDEYERKCNCKAGVVLSQNRHLGASYTVVSNTEAEEGIKKPGKYEWYLTFYPKSYFESLREKYIH